MIPPNVWNALTWAAQQPAGERQPGGFAPMLLMIGAIVFLYYLLLGRPKANEARQRQALLDNLAKGDAVMTHGGLYGTVESVDKEKGTVDLNVAPKVCIKFSKNAVANVIDKKKKPKEGSSGAAGAKS